MMKKAMRVTMILLLSATMIFGISHPHAGAFSNQVIQIGAVGDDVIELQARLQYLGFYRGKIDGVFGWGTYWALRNFQQQFGLKVDGLAGPKTKEKLVAASAYDEQYVKENIAKGKSFTHYGGSDIGRNGKAVKKGGTAQGGGTAQQKQGSTGQGGKTGQTSVKPNAVNVPNGFSQNDIRLMANAVYGEARGEPYVGKVAVAAVILNRVESPSFPDTVSGVIFEPGAFTAVADGQIWLTPDETSRQAVLDAINGWDPTGNALYYFNPATATNSWIWSRPQIKKIGKHIFCK